MCTLPAVQTSSLTIVVKFPMFKADFEAKETSYIACLASSLGVMVSLVRIQSVTEVFGRIMQLPGRRWLNTAVIVSSTVETSNRLEKSTLTEQLVLFGLPNPTSIDILYSSSQTSSLVISSTSNPKNDDNNFTTSSASLASLPVPIIAAISGGGFITLILVGFCLYMYQRRNRGRTEMTEKSIENEPSALVFSVTDNIRATAQTAANTLENLEVGDNLQTKRDKKIFKLGSIPRAQIDAGSSGATAQTTNALMNNLVEGEDLKGRYQPIVKYADISPSESAAESIMTCSTVLGIPTDKIKLALAEVDKITSSSLDTQDAQRMMSKFPTDKEKHSHALAIVMYTFDFSQLALGHAKEENFYFQLNQLLRKRNPKDLDQCASYLYYLMRGLEMLPSYSADQVLWRGVDAAGRKTLLENYKVGRKIHWSSFTSASLDQSVAREFAGDGGILLQVQLVENSRARDIRALAAIPTESEILLLPNFSVRVASGVKKLYDCDVLEVLEEVEESSTFVF